MLPSVVSRVSLFCQRKRFKKVRGMFNPMHSSVRQTKYMHAYVTLIYLRLRKITSWHRLINSKNYLLNLRDCDAQTILTNLRSRTKLKFILLTVELIQFEPIWQRCLSVSRPIFDLANSTFTIES